MDLPFSVVQFYAVFSAYNTTLWPVQIVLLALAFVAIGLMVFPRRGSGVAVSAILSVLWAWLALAYHLAFFTAISPPAYAFAALSLAGAGVFFWQGVVRRKLQFRWVPGLRAVMGGVPGGFRSGRVPRLDLPCRPSLPDFSDLRRAMPHGNLYAGAAGILESAVPTQPVRGPRTVEFRRRPGGFLAQCPGRLWTGRRGPDGYRADALA